MGQEKEWGEERETKKYELYLLLREVPKRDVVGIRHPSGSQNFIHLVLQIVPLAKTQRR